MPTIAYTALALQGSAIVGGRHALMTRLKNEGLIGALTGA
jgi:hypothetical protein